MKMLYLSRQDVIAARMTMAEVIERVEQAFRDKGEGRVEMPPKPGIHPAEDSFLNAMLAWIPTLKSAGLKWVAGYPANPAKNLPQISGLLILNDPGTGLPISVMDCTWITAVRTGAASAVAARYLADPGSESIGIFGCGVQGRSNLEAIKVVLPALATARCYDIERGRAEVYAEEMSNKLGMEVQPVDTPEQVAHGMDIVVSCAPILRTPQNTFQAGWIKPGAFVSAVDYDTYWAPQAMAEMDKFVTDDAAQYTHYKVDLGYFADNPPLYADLGEIVAGKKPARESPQERIMAMNQGVAIEDMAVAPRIYELARSKGLGTWLEL